MSDQASALAAALSREFGPRPPFWMVDGTPQQMVDYWHKKAESLLARLPVLAAPAAPTERLREDCIYCDADAYLRDDGEWECDFGHEYAHVAPPAAPALDVERCHCGHRNSTCTLP